ncbi:single-stranded DNA-binding protein [Paraburkholderia hospita]|uniref:single-stranded DNA-binding protein n=1 Tax=Paraburkholderia hospita TaxID=169430 RepID=UPI0008A72D18|nr:single-stranded DNA-binding protein [Paraburkholderia hospita]SEH89199.1 single-strand DNA-binding protein [Paraburkholderia hospita]
MILTGYCRIGNEPELRHTQGDNSTAVVNLDLAFNYGRRDDSGERPTQWVRGSLWGQRAEALIDYLVKGQGLDVVVDDVHVELYDKNNGEVGANLIGRIVMLEFAGSPPGGNQQQGNQQQRNGNGRTQQQTQGNNGRQQQQQRGNGNGRNSYSDAKNGRTQRGGYDDRESFE